MTTIYTNSEERLLIRNRALAIILAIDNGESTASIQALIDGLAQMGLFAKLSQAATPSK